MNSLKEKMRPIRVAIVGAGPAGFFAAGALLKQEIAVSIDFFERLPAPFGLVRYGVAPDHPKIKSVQRVYERTARDERVRFFGNVEFGRDVTHADLRTHYDQILYTVGAQSDRRLGIPGEDLQGSHSATEFVAWYNGHPDYAEHHFDLSHPNVVVIGAGNVALDVARILAKTVEELSTTDIADHTLEALERSSVENVYIVARRGPAQTKFSNPELREFGQLDVARPVVDPADLELDEASAASLEDSRTARNNVKIFHSFCELEGDREREVHFRFCTSPVEILEGEEGRVGAVRLVHNELIPDETGYIQSHATDAFETIEAGLVLRSVGYRGVRLEDVPFDERRAIIPNEKGRVLEEPGGAVVSGEYVAGWAKRGPSGVIGTNKADASETVKSMMEDLGMLTLVEDGSPKAIEELMKDRGVAFLTFEDWLKVDSVELERGESQKRPRVKCVSREEFFSLLDPS